MKQKSEKNIRNNAILLRKNHTELERDVEEQPVRLGDKSTGDKLIHINKHSDAALNVNSEKPKPSRNKSGSHSLSELRSFRSK